MLLLREIAALRKAFATGDLGSENLASRYIALIKEDLLNNMDGMTANQRRYVERQYESALETAQSKADSELYNQSKKEVGYDKDAIKRGIMADAGKREDSFGYGKSTIDLKGMSARNIDEISFAEALEKAGIVFENANHINTDSLVDAYTENYDELMQVLSQYSDLDAAQQIGQYLDNQKDNLDK